MLIRVWTVSRAETSQSYESEVQVIRHISFLLLSSVQAEMIHGNCQSHTPLTTAQTPFMDSLQCYEDYPQAWQRPVAPLQAPRHLRKGCNDVRPKNVVSLFPAHSLPMSPFFITGVWTNGGVRERVSVAMSHLNSLDLLWIYHNALHTSVSSLMRPGSLWVTFIAVHSHCSPNDKVTHMFSGVSSLWLQPYDRKLWSGLYMVSILQDLNPCII